MNNKTKLIVEKYIGEIDEIDEGILRRYGIKSEVYFETNEYGKAAIKRTFLEEIEKIADSMFGKNDTRYKEVNDYAKKIADVDFEGMSDKKAKKKFKEIVKLVDKKITELKKRK